MRKEHPTDFVLFDAFAIDIGVWTSRRKKLRLSLQHDVWYFGVSGNYRRLTNHLIGMTNQKGWNESFCLDVDIVISIDRQKDPISALVRSLRKVLGCAFSCTVWTRHQNSRASNGVSASVEDQTNHRRRHLRNLIPLSMGFFGRVQVELVDRPPGKASEDHNN